MKLSEIEAYAYEVIYPDCDGELFFTLYLAKERAAEVGGDIRNLHTPEQMQEYAKECVREAYKEIVKNSYVSDDRVEQAGLNEIINKVFEEDTKND
ncbi:hypothetical protein [Lactococcus lactis]|uniref:hypothetical protein n=1 Tax=Lactococcus lactis TaxID=1358 RepID=UPI000723AB46|nr:hypothetical protein [Lactococcus lactis]KSU17947.1 hypothetical protein LMG14418_1772 [Lactococcus lactis subsp. lactis]